MPEINILIERSNHSATSFATSLHQQVKWKCNMYIYSGYSHPYLRQAKPMWGWARDGTRILNAMGTDAFMTPIPLLLICSCHLSSFKPPSAPPLSAFGATAAKRCTDDMHEQKLRVPYYSLSSYVRCFTRIMCSVGSKTVYTLLICFTYRVASQLLAHEKAFTIKMYITWGWRRMRCICKFWLLTPTMKTALFGT